MRTTQRACYVCSQSGNPIVASEAPVEHRFGRPLLPEGVYDFARCHRCGTLYVDSSVSQDYLDGIYEPESEESVLEMGVSHAGLVALRIAEFEKSWESLKKWRVPQPEDQLLDFGCQTGEMGSIAAKDGVIPNGIELSKAYAEHCRKTWGTQSRVFSCSISDTLFRRGELQYISAFEVLEHMCDPLSALATMRGWLSPDGLIAVSVPSADYFHFKYWLLRSRAVSWLSRPFFERRSSFYKKQVLPHSHIYNFSHASLRMLLEKAGFTPLEVGLTGWHGRLSPALSAAGRAIELASRRRVGIAPSLFAVARPGHVA